MLEFELQSKALDATEEGIIITDMRAPDQPIVCSFLCALADTHIHKHTHKHTHRASYLSKGLIYETRDTNSVCACTHTHSHMTNSRSSAHTQDS